MASRPLPSLLALLFPTVYTLPLVGAGQSVACAVRPSGQALATLGLGSIVSIRGLWSRLLVCTIAVIKTAVVSWEALAGTSVCGGVLRGDSAPEAVALAPKHTRGRCLVAGRQCLAVRLLLSLSMSYHCVSGRDGRSCHGGMHARACLRQDWEVTGTTQATGGGHPVLAALGPRLHSATCGLERVACLTLPPPPQDYICPRCESGFIEELPEETR